MKNLYLKRRFYPPCGWKMSNLFFKRMNDKTPKHMLNLFDKKYHFFLLDRLTSNSSLEREIFRKDKTYKQKKGNYYNRKGGYVTADAHLNREHHHSKCYQQPFYYELKEEYGDFYYITKEYFKNKKDADQEGKKRLTKGWKVQGPNKVHQLQSYTIIQYKNKNKK